MRLKVLCVAFTLVMGVSPGYGLVIWEGTSANNRFTSLPSQGNPDTDNPDFLFGDYDWSGVGWRDNDPDISVTLITDRHFIGAAHIAANVGSTINFKSANGTFEQYTVANTTVLAQAVVIDNVLQVVDTDLYIGELTQSVAGDGIAHYNYGVGDPVGERVLVYGRSKNVGEQTIDGAQLVVLRDDDGNIESVTQDLTSTFLSDAQAGQRETFDSRFQPGDSSSPTFVVVDNELVLLGVHSATSGFDQNETITLFDNYVTPYASQINAVIAASGETFDGTAIPEPAPVPEPTAAWLLAGTGMLLLARRRA